MKNSLKKFGSLALVAVMTLALAACAKPTADVIQKKAEESMKKVKSYSVSFQADMSGIALPDASGQGNPDAKITVTGTGDFIQTPGKTDEKKAFNVNPSKMKMNAKTELMGMSLDIPFYADISSQQGKFYFSVLGQWQGFSMDFDKIIEQSKLKEADQSKLEDFSKTIYSKMVLIGEEKLDKIKAYHLSATITGQDLKEAFEAVSTKEDLDKLPADFNETLNSLGSMTIDMWINKANYQYAKMSIDMSDLMRSALKSQGSLVPVETSDNLTFVMTMDFVNYNKVEDFEIPAEALSANMQTLP